MDATFLLWVRMLALLATKVCLNAEAEAEVAGIVIAAVFVVSKQTFDGHVLI